MLSIYFRVYLSCVSTLEVEGGIHSWKQSAPSTSCKEVEKKRRVSSPIQVNFYFEYVIFFDKPKRLLCQTCNLIQITINTKAKTYSTLNIFCALTAFLKKSFNLFFILMFRIFPPLRSSSLFNVFIVSEGFLGGLAGKESVCSAGDLGSIPSSQRWMW